MVYSKESWGINFPNGIPGRPITKEETIKLLDIAVVEHFNSHPMTINNCFLKFIDNTNAVVNVSISDILHCGAPINLVGDEMELAHEEIIVRH